MMDSAPSGTNSAPVSTAELPPEAIALASKIFEAARIGDEKSVALLMQALQAGLPANLTNDKGDSLVSSTPILPAVSDQDCMCCANLFTQRAALSTPMLSVLQLRKAET